MPLAPSQPPLPSPHTHSLRHWDYSILYNVRLLITGESGRGMAVRISRNLQQPPLAKRIVCACEDYCVFVYVSIQA